MLITSSLAPYKLFCVLYELFVNSDKQFYFHYERFVTSPNSRMLITSCFLLLSNELFATTDRVSAARCKFSVSQRAEFFIASRLLPPKICVQLVTTCLLLKNYDEQSALSDEQ